MDEEMRETVVNQPVLRYADVVAVFDSIRRNESFASVLYGVDIDSAIKRIYDELSLELELEHKSKSEEWLARWQRK